MKYLSLVVPIEDNDINDQKLSSMNKKVMTNRDVVYIYLGKNSIYIGQTKNLRSRHNQHKVDLRFKMEEFDQLVVVFGVDVDRNLDYLERQLITLFTADNESRSLKSRKRIKNSTRGNTTNNYAFNTSLDHNVIIPLWENDLVKIGCVFNSKVSHLKNSILFKYSPFMILSDEQKEIINRVITVPKNYLIEGGSGTGKTVLMTNLATQISNYDKDKTIGVIVKSNWRENAKRIFEDYGHNKNIVVSTWGFISKSKEKFDYIIIDEAHRMPRNYGKLHPTEKSYFSSSKQNSLELIKSKTDNLVLLYDRDQTIRPSDIPREEFIKFTSEQNFEKINLTEQFRIDVDDKFKKYSSNDYIKGIKYLLDMSNDKSFDSDLFNNPDPDAYFGFSNSIQELFEYVDRMNNLIEDSRNRVIAGYAREWKSKKNANVFDWYEEDSKWRWNSTYVDWINKKGSENEIGSIHAVQGIDLNCVGLVIGKDLTFKDGKVVANINHYFDKNGKLIKSEFSEKEFAEYVKNIYYTLMTRGIDGIRVYIEDKVLRDHFNEKLTF